MEAAASRVKPVKANGTRELSCAPNVVAAATMKIESTRAITRGLTVSSGRRASFAKRFAVITERTLTEIDLPQHRGVRTSRLRRAASSALPLSFENAWKHP